MDSLGTAQLISLLLAVTVVATLSGFFAAVVTRRPRRRTRGIFVAGVVCGVLARELVRGRRRALALGSRVKLFR
ncbi:MAG: hypothetical protein WA944_21205 [Mycobacterium sp.]